MPSKLRTETSYLQELVKHHNTNAYQQIKLAYNGVRAALNSPLSNR